MNVVYSGVAGRVVVGVGLSADRPLSVVGVQVYVFFSTKYGAGIAAEYKKKTKRDNKD